jgi:hypothetical protein
MAYDRCVVRDADPLRKHRRLRLAAVLERRCLRRRRAQLQVTMQSIGIMVIIRLYAVVK